MDSISPKGFGSLLLGDMVTILLGGSQMMTTVSGLDIVGLKSPSGGGQFYML